MCFTAIVIVRGVIDCNEWKTAKRYECTNTGKVKRFEL